MSVGAQADFSALLAALRAWSERDAQETRQDVGAAAQRLKAVIRSRRPQFLEALATGLADEVMRLPMRSVRRAAVCSLIASLIEKVNDDPGDLRVPEGHVSDRSDVYG